MSGHSKWSNIKNRKGAADNKRGQVFSQFSKLIRIAVKEGKSGDPQFNASLRLLIEKAKAVNMPKGNIERAIERGLGKGKGGAAIQEIVYEGYGPGGVGLLVMAMTDNPQRTAAEIRNIFSKAGGALAGPGSVMFMFHRQGDDYQVTLPTPVEDPEIQATTRDLIETLRDNEDVEDVFCAGTWTDAEAEQEE